MVNEAIPLAFNIALNIILVKFMSHSRLILVTMIATIITTTLLVTVLKKDIGSLGTKGYIITLHG